MAKVQSQYKVDRKVGANILGRQKSSFNTRAYLPGRHGFKYNKTRVPKKSEYKLKLNEYHKLKVSFGIEKRRTLESIFSEAQRVRSITKKSLHDIFLGMLEKRLLTMVYRAKFGATPNAAKQLIIHKNILVNGKVVHSPGYIVKVGDIISLHGDLHNNIHVKSAFSSNERLFPQYLEVKSNMSATLKEEPHLSLIPLATKIELNMVVEFLNS